MLLIIGLWPMTPKPNEVTVEAALRLLAGVSFDQAITAVESLAKDGRDFAPNAGQIARRAEELARSDAPPSEAEALRMVERAFRYPPEKRPSITHPLIDEAIACLGGWKEAGHMDSKDLRVAFGRYYRQLVERADEEYFMPVSAKAVRAAALGAVAGSSIPQLGP